MNSTGPEDSIQGIREVSKAYSTANFDEEPPASLDRAILTAARRRPKPRLAAFIPALALAATVVLSFSVMLRIGVLNIGDEVTQTASEPQPALESQQLDQPALDSLAPEGDFVESLEEEASLPTPTLRQERALNEPATTTAPGRTRSLSPTAASDAAPLAGAEELMLQNAQTLEARTEEAATLRSRAAGDAMEDCESLSSGDPETWVECISSQLQQGNEETARLQLDAFVRAHPDYPLPEELLTLRVP